MPTNYVPHHGDIYLLKDRKQIGYSLEGTNFSINPNIWMMATDSITKGWLVASVTGSNNQVTIADKDSVVSILGVSINSVTATSPIPLTATVVEDSNSITVADSTGIVAGMLVTGGDVPSNTFVESVPDATHILLTRDYPGTSGSVSLVFGSAVEIVTSGIIEYTTKVFELSEVGQTVYPAPEEASSFTSPGTKGTHPQLTVNRGYAATSGQPLMEIGIILSETTLLVDLNGDARGATGLTQIAEQAGEVITNEGTPLVISMGTNGKVFLADRRKNNNGTTELRNTPFGILIGANSGYGTGGTIPLNELCIIQKLGTISGFTGLVSGKPVYLDINGGYTQNIETISYYTDVATPIGWALSSTSMFVSMGFNTQTSDAEQVGGIIALNPSGIADYGYLLANGASMNIVGTTTNPTGQVAGIYDGTSLYNKIGTTFGGTAEFTVTVSGGTPIVGQTLYINGISVAITGVTAADIATQLAGLTQTGYTFASVSSGVFSVQNDSTHTPVNIVMGTLQYTSIVVSGGTYNLPNLNSGNPKFQIKYLNFYQANPPQAPLFRYDTGWTQWGTVPSGSSSSNPFEYIDIPISTFGASPAITDFFADLFIQKGGVIRKVEPNPVIYTKIEVSTIYYRYGYQLKWNSTSPNTARIEFGSDGLAYFDVTTSTFIPIDSTWTYKILLYKTERYNKFYDYTSDQKLSQVWSLGLADYTEATDTHNPTTGGYFDRSSTAPNHTTRLNYDGNFYTTNIFISDSLNVTGLSTFNNGVIVSNSLNSRKTLNVTAPSDQTVDIFSVNKTGISFPFFIVDPSGKVGISNTSSNTPTGLFDVKGSNGIFRINETVDTLSMVRDGETKFNVGNSGVSSLSFQVNGGTKLHINNEGDIGIFDNPATAIQSSSEKVLEIRSDDNVTGSSIHLYSHDITAIKGILTANVNGVYLDSAASTTKSIDLRIGGSSGFYLRSDKNITLGTSSTITTPSENITSKIIEARSENNTDGVILYLTTANGTSAKTMLSSQITGFTIDSNTHTLKVGGSSALSINSSRYVQVATRLGIGGEATNLFQVFSPSTTGAAIFSSTGTIRTISLYPIVASGDHGNAILQAGDSLLKYSDTLVVAPGSSGGVLRGVRFTSSGNATFWGTTQFQSSSTSAEQVVEVASGYVKINATSSGSSTSVFSVADYLGNSLGGFGGRFLDEDSLDFFFIASNPISNPEFTLSPITGNGIFRGTCQATSFFGNLGSSGTPSTDAFISTASINSATITEAEITDATVTNLLASKIGWDGSAVSPISEAYVTTIGSDISYSTSAYIRNIHANRLTLNAGTDSVAPLIFTSGVLLTTPVNGALEYVSNDFYATTGGTRYSIPLSTSGNSLRFVTTGSSVLTLPSGEKTLATNEVATSSSAGLLPSLPGDASQYLKGNGKWGDFATATGVKDGLLSISFSLGSIVNESVTFSANSAENKTLTINIDASSTPNGGYVTVYDASGGLNATYFNATSLRASKENIIPFTQSALSVFDTVSICSYNFIDDPDKNYKLGFIADDTHEYLSTKNHNQMDITNTIGLLIKAVQELRQENKELRNLIKGLK